MRLEDNKNKKTQKRNIWKVGVLQRKRLFVLAFLVFLGWFGFSSADINNLNLFEDNDGDGLTNEEELMYGTDPDNKDSDSAGIASDQIALAFLSGTRQNKQVEKTTIPIKMFFFVVLFIYCDYFSSLSIEETILFKSNSSISYSSSN